MGLSASQARLLSLTARQSNLEYEGQQINQQRTTLSNESSNYYNSLLEMSVPVPPSTNDYTKIVYTFTIGGNEATVKEALPKQDADGNTNYYVTYTTQLSTVGIQENDAFKTSASAKKSNGIVTYATAKVGAGNLRYDADAVKNGTQYYLATMNRIGTKEQAEEVRKQTDTKIYVQSDTQSGQVIIGPDGYQITEAQYKEIIKKDPNKQKECRFYNEVDDTKNDADYAAKTRYTISYAQIPDETTFNSHKSDDVIYTIQETNDIYEADGKTKKQGAQKGLFSYKASNGNNFTVVEPQYADAFTNAGLDVNDYYQYTATSGVRFVKREDVEGNLNTESITIKTSAVATIKKTQENSLANATIEFDNQGRISTLTDEEGHTYTMTATTETDNAAYEDAYNQYEYNQYVYDQKQNEINANIEILQAQDKSLELRLSTLDTQHTAIQTELEAVKKVMSKNIDNSFKTFNA